MKTHVRIMRDITYSLRTVSKCNMCGASPEQFVVLGKRLNQRQGFNPRGKTGFTTTVCRCASCGLIFASPLPVPNDIADHYGVPPESYWHDTYFEINPDYFKGEIAWLSRLKDIRPGMKSLDIGAGIGKQMIAMQQSGFDAYGIEPSRPFHNRAIEKMGLDSTRLLQVSVEDAEFEHSTFDFISFGAVFEHLYDPSAALVKAFSWLKPDGLIHIEVPSSQWFIAKLLNLFYRMRGLDYVSNLSPMHPPFHLTEYSLKSFERNGALNGYRIRDHGYYVCQTYMPRFLDPLLATYMQATNTGMQLCVWLSPSDD